MKCVHLHIVNCQQVSALWVVLQAAWEQAVVQDILGGMAALRFFCRDLEQAQQQGLAHLHSLHQSDAQVPFLPFSMSDELSAVNESSMERMKW